MQVTIRYNMSISLPRDEYQSKMPLSVYPALPVHFIQHIHNIKNNNNNNNNNTMITKTTTISTTIIIIIEVYLSISSNIYSFAPLNTTVHADPFLHPLKYSSSPSPTLSSDTSWHSPRAEGSKASSPKRVVCERGNRSFVWERVRDKVYCERERERDKGEVCVCVCVCVWGK